MVASGYALIIESLTESQCNALPHEYEDATTTYIRRAEILSHM